MRESRTISDSTKQEPQPLPSGGRVVVAEDDHFFRLILVKRLRAAGHEVVVTANGEEAWQAIQSDPPELLLTDWMMPKLDGYDLCRMVKEAPLLRSIYCILLTAKDGTEEMVSALDIGADDYLVKPCEDNELLARVRTGLRVHRLCSDLKEASVTDSLTGLRNRRFFDTQIDEEIARSRRYFTPLSLTLFDLDGFKTINDTYGHPVGDEVLSQVGVAIATRRRTGDVLARFGGDEFAVLLPCTELEGAHSYTDDVVRIVDSLDLPSKFAGVKLGVSAGSAELRPGWEGPDLIAAADAELYRNKRTRLATTR